MFSGLFGGGGSAKRAAEVAASGQRAAGKLIDDRYQEVSQFYDPYQQAGTQALGGYQEQLATLPGYTDRINQYTSSIDPIMSKIQSTNLDDYQTSPGYEFRMQQGQRALEASRAAGGNLNSGATGKALLEYGQGIGSAEYQNYLTNLYNQIGGVQAQIGGVQAGQQSVGQTLDAYGNLINTGYNAAAAKANLGMGAAQQQGAFLTGAADATAGGMMAKSNQMQAAGDQWIKLGSMAGGAAAGGMVPGGMGALQGAQVGSQFGGYLQSPQQAQLASQAGMRPQQLSYARGY